MELEAETGVGLLPAMGLVGLLAILRAWKDPPLESLEGARLCQQLDFSTPASGTVRERVSVV